MSVSGGSCCQQCSSTISKGQRFCANCGLRVDYDTAQGNLSIRFCSSCGTENETYISDKTVTQTGAHITKIVQIDESDDDEYFSTEEDSAGSSTRNDIQRDTYLQSENDELHDYLENIESSTENGSSTRNDIQKDTYLQSENDGLHDYSENTESSTENEEIFMSYMPKYKKDGFMKTTSYCRNKLNEVNKGIIKFAVIGRSAVGKSSFINMMLNLQAGKKCYAETGSGDTTQEMIVYKHPKNENITF
ncbi:unnamed protein product [Mytilus edulis]|uniref:IRG-type G domain-containing protein n=1 Tax=Mytilus edulis TaxID=6550 RepID=A0A8S3QZK7_MYTED|nr:unnamed protein product [Mytilus edulis]